MAPHREIGVRIVQRKRQVADRVGQVEAGHRAQVAGGDHVVVPSAVVMTFFAFFATWVVAKYGFRRDGAD